MSTPLLNKSQIKKFVKTRFEEHGREFVGVSDSFYASLEDRLKIVINDAILRIPDDRKRLSRVPQGFTA